jgi:hypothetical protein
MLRGWDLPIQANISVSFNTKLIPFNLVIAVVCPLPFKTDLRFILPTTIRTSDPCRSPADTLPEPTITRVRLLRPDKSKTSFFPDGNLAQEGMVIYFQIPKIELALITLFIMIPFFILLGLWLGGHLGGCGC